MNTHIPSILHAFLQAQLVVERQHICVDWLVWGGGSRRETAMCRVCLIKRSVLRSNRPKRVCCNIHSLKYCRYRLRGALLQGQDLGLVAWLSSYLPSSLRRHPKRMVTQTSKWRIEARIGCLLHCEPPLISPSCRPVVS